MTTAKQLAVKPFKVAGEVVTSAEIAAAISMLANLPRSFKASDLTTAIRLNTYHAQQEALNRLMQRWRKLDLVRFTHGRWTLVPGAWDKLQAAAQAIKEQANA